LQKTETILAEAVLVETILAEAVLPATAIRRFLQGQYFFRAYALKPILSLQLIF